MKTATTFAAWLTWFIIRAIIMAAACITSFAVIMFPIATIIQRHVADMYVFITLMLLPTLISMLVSMLIYTCLRNWVAHAFQKMGK